MSLVVFLRIGVGYMKTFAKWLCMSAVVLSAGTATASEGGLIGLFLKTDRSTKPTNVGTNVMPPLGFEGRRWVHPNGCQYSRAGRPGELVWYLVATGAKGCSAYFVQYSPYRSPY